MPKKFTPIITLDGILAAAYHPRYAYGVSAASTAKVRHNLVAVRQRYEAADLPVLNFLFTMNAALLLEQTLEPGLTARPSFLRQRDYTEPTNGNAHRFDLTVHSANRHLLPAGEYHMRTDAAPILAPALDPSIASAQDASAFSMDKPAALALAGQLLSRNPAEGDFNVQSLGTTLLDQLMKVGPHNMSQPALAA